MSLFEVPGWSVPTTAAASSSTNSKKRKRPGPESQSKVQSAAVNVEKLFAKLGQGDDEDSKKNKNKKGSKGKGKAAERTASVQKAGEQSKAAKKAKKAHPTDNREDLPRPASAASETKGKKSKGPDKREPKPTQAASKQTTPNEKNANPAKGLTTLQANMKHSLDGARFRWINETLYKSDSDHARQMMRENPTIFSEYHTGFRHQVQSWPVNPVSHYASALSNYPAKTVIADLGCGDAALASALVPKDYIVLSYDLVSDGAFVVEADICTRVPLPGSEGQDLEETEHGAQVVDVVVFALSLMSVNWVGAIREAWRVLKPDGELKIAEVASRFEDVETFTSLVSSVGFRLRSKDDSNTYFTLFEFTKVSRKPKSDKEWSKLMERGSILKPCEYKRR